MEANRFVTLLGDAAKNLLFARMRGREALGRPFEYELEVLSEDFSIDLSTVLGQSVTVRIELQSGDDYRYINGVVTYFKLAGTEGRFARYQAVLNPSLSLLQRRINCRIFQELSARDVITNLFRESGFVAFEDRLQGEYPPIEYLVQYRESDFDFVSRLMEREGIYYYFVHESGQHTLVLADSPFAHELAPGYEGIPYRPVGERSAEVEYLQTWSYSLQLVSGACALRDFNFEQPAARPHAARESPTGNLHGNLEVYDYPGLFTKSSEGDARACLRLEREQTQHRIYEGVGELRGLSSGWRFAVTGYPGEEQNREYVVVASLLDVSANAYETRGDSVATCRCYLTAIQSDQQFRSPESTPKPTVDGPQTAIVVGPANEEIWTDKYGRVKLQFHWDRYGESDENSSCWVRVSHAWAGSNWGFVQIPRIGQEVIVSFLEGDPDRPIVTGRVYNGSHLPPYKLPNMATQSGIKTRSSKGGTPNDCNEIRFEDRKGHEELFIQAQRQQTTLVKASQSISVGANRSVSTGANETVSVGANRTTTVGAVETGLFGDARVTTVAKTDDLTIQQKHTGTYHGGREVNVDGADDNLTVGGANKNTTVHGEYNVVADTHFKVTQKGTSLLLEDKGELASDGPIRLSNGKCCVELKDEKITLTAASEIAVVCGQASITMKKDGTIEIGGATTVKLSGGSGRVELAATGTKVSGPQVDLSGASMTKIAGGLVKLN
jgi:type VI secretion system secreted protein VgrG